MLGGCSRENPVPFISAQKLCRAVCAALAKIWLHCVSEVLRCKRDMLKAVSMASGLEEM